MWRELKAPRKCRDCAAIPTIPDSEHIDMQTPKLQTQNLTQKSKTKRIPDCRKGEKLNEPNGLRDMGALHTKRVAVEVMPGEQNYILLKGVIVRFPCCEQTP